MFKERAEVSYVHIQLSEDEKYYFCSWILLPYSIWGQSNPPLYKSTIILESLKELFNSFNYSLVIELSYNLLFSWVCFFIFTKDSEINPCPKPLHEHDWKDNQSWPQ